MSLITKITDLAIAIATDIKSLDTNVSLFDGRVTTLEQTESDNNLRLTALESNTGGDEPLTMQEVRYEIARWGVYRDEYAGTGWYKDANGRVYCKDVPSLETKQFSGDINTYISLYDSDFSDRSTRTLLRNTENLVVATSNLTKLAFTSNPEIGSLFRLQGRKADANVQSWDVGHITNFDYALSEARSVKGLSYIDTSNMTSAVHAFYSTSFDDACDVSNMDTSKLVNAEGMFQAMRADSLVGFDGLDTSNITNAKDMFRFARAEGDPVDVSGWDVSKLINAESMFEYASLSGGYNSQSVEGLDNWRVGNITNMTNMLEGLDDISSDLSGWCVSNITTEPSGFSEIPADKKPIWGTCPYAGYGWYKDPVSGIVECNEVPDGETHQFDGDPKTYVCVYSKNEINPSNMDVVATSNVTKLDFVLNYKSGVNKDISHWDVSNVTYMDYAFRDSDFAGDLSSWKVPLIDTKPYGFLAGTPIENDLTKHPQWGA